MSRDEFEHKLKAVPVRSLSARADAEIVAAVRAATGQACPWYVRSVPLWHAAAACILLCAATWLLGSIGRTPTTLRGDRSTGLEAGSVVVHFDEPLFRETSSLDRMDVSRWRVCMSPVTE